MGSRTSRGTVQPPQRRAIIASIARFSSPLGIDHIFYFLRSVAWRGDQKLTTDLIQIICLQQALQQRAAKIAESYTVDKALWMQAAAELRQPFWDWARSEGPVPPEEVISMPKVKIIIPSGLKALVDNPFLTFIFPSKESRASFDGDFEIWTKTLRNPEGEGDNAVSSVESLKELVNSN
jgi:hypothetical protein